MIMNAVPSPSRTVVLSYVSQNLSCLPWRMFGAFGREASARHDVQQLLVSVLSIVSCSPMTAGSNRACPLHSEWHSNRSSNVKLQYAGCWAASAALQRLDTQNTLVLVERQSVESYSRCRPSRKFSKGTASPLAPSTSVVVELSKSYSLERSWRYGF